MVRKERIRRGFRCNLLIQRVVLIWNELAEEAIETEVTMTIKRHLLRYVDWKGLIGCMPNAGNRTSTECQLDQHGHGGLKNLWLYKFSSVIMFAHQQLQTNLDKCTARKCQAGYGPNTGKCTNLVIKPGRHEQVGLKGLFLCFMNR